MPGEGNLVESRSIQVHISKSGHCDGPKEHVTSDLEV
jgi:hypothetical protein